MNFNSLAEIVGGRLITSGSAERDFAGVSIDSRTSVRNELFVAIVGDKTDGHKYIDKAIEKNIAGLMVNENYSQLNEIAELIPVVVVSDTHQSLKQMALKYAETVNAKYIAVTGSNGKTTTKEFIYGIINHLDPKSYRTPGNLNNLFGLPLAIFKMPSDCTYGIFEYGISTPGEMTSLTKILTPDIAVITNVGPTHLETLDTVEGVAEAKLELADAMPVEAPVIINADDPVLMKAAQKRDRQFVTFGVNNRADFIAERAGISRNGYQIIKIDGETVYLPIFGEHQVYNLLAGYTVAKTLGFEFDIDSLNEIEYNFAPYRGQIEHFDSLTLIVDCYNANPVSMASGLKSFDNYIDHLPEERGRTIAVIGDMLELGENSKKHHQEIGKLLASLKIDNAFIVGKEAVETYHSALENGFGQDNIWHFKNAGTAAEAVLKNIERGDIIYFKASRGIALENIITLIKGSAFRQN